MLHCLVAALPSIAASSVLLFLQTPVHAADLLHLRLVDRLDRPADGYCLDILGGGRNLRLDVPIFAHNCKPTLTNDSAVDRLADGGIRFAAVDLCITAAGVNSKALPGASILLRPCGHDVAFFETGDLQKFRYRSDGKLELGASGLCLAVGAVSSETYSPSDRWRVLSVEDCAGTPASLSTWEFVIPQDN